MKRPQDPCRMRLFTVAVTNHDAALAALLPTPVRICICLLSLVNFAKLEQTASAYLLSRSSMNGPDRPLYAMSGVPISSFFWPYTMGLSSRATRHPGPPDNRLFSQMPNAASR